MVLTLCAPTGINKFTCYSVTSDKAHTKATSAAFFLKYIDKITYLCVYWLSNNFHVDELCMEKVSLISKIMFSKILMTILSKSVLSCLQISDSYRGDENAFSIINLFL